MPMEVMGALTYLRNAEPFDIIFMDPPYRGNWVEKVLMALADNAVCSRDTLVIFEAAIKEETAFIGECGFEVIREKSYKTNKHIFVKKK